MNPAISVRGLTKSYGSRSPVHALRGASFDLPAGAVTAVVGPNGAGKTTCFNVLMGLLKPDSGSIEVSGSARLAYLADRSALDPLRSVRSVMTAHEKIVLAANPTAAPNGNMLIDRLEVRHLLAKRPSALSRGEAQRVSICLALLGDPAVAILDEPLASLDIVMRDRFRAELRSRSERKYATVLSTHSVPDVEAIADWLVVLHRGVIRYSGPVQELMSSEAFVGTLRGSSEAVRSVAKAVPWLEPLSENEEIRIALSERHWSQLKRKADSGATFEDAREVRASLEQIVLFLSGGA